MEKIYFFKALHNLFQVGERLFWNLWWVILIFLLGLIILEQSLKSLQKEQDQLRQQYRHLIQEKEKALALKNKLKLKINSQSDPAWVELTLKKRLGLVPEGQIKVLFID